MNAEEARVAASLGPELVRRIDEEILRHARPRLQKVAMLVGLAMGNEALRVPGLPDLYYVQRVRALVEKGRVSRRRQSRLHAIRRGTATVTHQALELAFPERPAPDMTLRQGQLADQSMSRKISHEEWDAAGRLDAHLTWKEISVGALVECDAALSHLSNRGFVYYIPAYIRAALNHVRRPVEQTEDLLTSTVFHLTARDHCSLPRLKLFSDSQIDAVILFLKEVSQTNGFDGEAAGEALKNYWLTPEARQGLKSPILSP